MKLECPFCWQHYEIDKAERNQTFTCVCCNQTFNGCDAHVLHDRNTERDRRLAVLLIAGFLLIVLAAWWIIRTEANRCHREVDELRQRIKVLEANTAQNGAKE